ncbi:MAG: histidinol dehydrogenase [Provencibacterium sp.]|jgi:histidinol dehydrogenase|nr:histidinol dehydrogenase [Provencibacterium sp.]
MIQKVMADGSAEKELLSSLRERSEETDHRVSETVRAIIDEVRARGDAALKDYAERFDGSSPERLEVSREEINDALTSADPKLVQALLNAQEKIATFHQRQKREAFVDLQADGVILGQRLRGLDRVGLYVPGGTAAYPSTVLMNAIPAKIAGVRELIMVTPPQNGQANPDILLAAAIAGVDRVFLCGGAQAVAALCYGTGTIPRVDKIVGPGNIYVATAKKLLYGVVDIDMIAGPSEILVMADGTANPRYVAADLLSQAEHDRMASAILLTDSEKMADAVIEELEKQTALLSRREIIEQSLKDWGAVIVCRDRTQMVELANRVAPEHLEVCCENPLEYVGRLDNAGSIFLGNFAPEPLGDYYAGPNHVLPTSGTARFFSPLSVDSFIKRSSFIYYTREALSGAREDIELLARTEGLTAHASAVSIRFEKE